jgi:hypothetical protein
MEELIQLAIALPKFQKEFFEIIQNILNLFFKECKIKYYEIIEGKFVENNIEINKKNWEFMRLDSKWKKLQKNYNHHFFNNNEEEYLTFLKENVDDKLLNLKHISKDLFIDNTTQLILLANLCDSLEWISIKIIDTSDEYNRHIEINNENNIDNLSKTTVIEKEYFSKFKNLSEICLFTLKLDLRIRIFYHLNEMKNVIF